MKRIVWDWNGTLFDDLDLCFGCINRLLKSQDLKPLKDLDAYRHVFGFPIVDYYKRVGFDFNQTSFEVLAHQYMEDYQEKSLMCSLFDDVLQTLDTNPYPQVILSASKKDFLLQQTSLFHLEDYVDDILGITDIYGHSKVELAKTFRNQYPLDDIWFVGDSKHDYEVAKSIGAHCVLVATGHQAKDVLEQIGVPVVDHLAESLEYIDERD